jgi:cyanamide hydratase
MSFGFYGALKALEFLATVDTPIDQAEAVAETIIRHQDLGIEGSITFLGQLIQLATIYEYVSDYPTIGGFGGLIHHDSLVDVHKLFPREGWLRCFGDLIFEEENMKPWCHSTHIPCFREKVLANTRMKRFE